MRETRREFLKVAAAGLVAAAGVSPAAQKQARFEISLAQWSFHKALFSKQLDNLDFAIKARNDYGIGAVEYVNQFFKDKAKDQAYLAEMKKRASDHDVRNVLIMCDGEGALGDADPAKRHAADAAGTDTKTDYGRMLKIVLDAGYKGYIGIEYEGATLSEADGVRATQKLLEKYRFA
jgi:formyltetrahydrofolate synthetase